MKRHALVIKEQDNVATAIADIPEGTSAVVGIGQETVSIPLAQEIGLGHKFAVRNIGKGENVLKYNCVIGRATQDIRTGEHVHVQNLESLRGRGDL